jgi:hypothetical protein
LQLRDALGDNGKMIMDAASSKGFELRPRERVPGLSWNWLGVRDDFRNWFVRTARTGTDASTTGDT